MLVGAAAADASCPEGADPEACRIDAARRYRGVGPRVFQKALRSEISLVGGAYAADGFSTSYLFGGAYTFHVSESLGLELAFHYARAESELARLVEEETGERLVRDHEDVFLYLGHLVWSVAYGKLRFVGGGISRFDLYLSLGGGVTDADTSRGVTLSFGVGLKVALTTWFALRIDIRDHLLAQEVVGESTWANNIVPSLGLSFFL